MRDQTVGSNSREGGAWPGKQGRLGIAIDWVTSRSTLKRVGSMYSQAHISLFNIYWRVWLLVIREAEKAPLGSLEAFFNCRFNQIHSQTQQVYRVTEATAAQSLCLLFALNLFHLIVKHPQFWRP